MDQDKTTRIVCRSILAVLGVLLLVAGFFKIVSPYEARTAISAVVADVGDIGFPLGQYLNLLIAGVVATEVLLGIMLVFFIRPKLVACLTIVMLTVFTVFLWRMLQLPEVPSCGCLGRWSAPVEDGRSQAWFGIVRNVAFSVLAGWCIFSLRPGPMRVQEAHRLKAAGSRGFTLIELLVTVVVIAILIGILLPSLGAARRSAKVSRHLSNTRQLLVALNTYAGEFQDRFPAVLAGSGEDTDPMGQPIAGSSLPPQSYLVRNTVFWTDPLYRSGHDLPAEGFFGPPDELNPIRRTHYLLTGTAFAEPEVFVDDPDDVGPLMRVQRLSRTRHPGSKGYLLVTHSDGWPADRADLDPVLAGLGDGSASRRIPRADALGDPNGNAIGMPSWPVLWTRNGLEGRDF